MLTICPFIAAATLAGVDLVSHVDPMIGAAEFRARDFYALEKDGVRRPLAASDMSGDFIRVGGAPAKCVALKDVKPGRYRIRVTRAAAESAEGESPPSPLYLNGRRLDCVRATSPRLFGGEGSPEVVFAETDLVPIADGDILALYAGRERAERERCRIFAIAITPEPLDAAWLKLDDYAALGRFAYLEWSPDSRMAAGCLDLRFANLLGKPVAVTLDWRITDYWQKEIARGTRRVKVGGICSETIAFPTGGCHQYRAEVAVRYPDGHVEHRRYACDAPCLRGFRRRFEMNGCPWEVAWTTDDGTLATRELRDRPPPDAVWRKVSLPDAFNRSFDGKPSYQRWYRTSVVLPEDCEGERMFFSFQWCNCVNRLFVNGHLAGESAMARQTLPCEFDITPFLLRGATNEILLATQGASAACPASVLAERRVLNASDAVLGSAQMGRKMVFLDPAVESRPARAIGAAPRVVCSYRDRTLEVVDPPIPDRTAIRYRVLFRGEEVVAPFLGKVEWKNPPLWGPDEFPLLELEATLTDRDTRAVIDRISTRFGFREIWAEGGSLIWNGRRVKGVARACGTYPYGYSTQTKQETLDRLEPFRRLGNLILAHSRGSAATYDFCDELGILARRTSGLCFVTLSESEIASDAWWQTAEDGAKATVDALPNHPSLYCWYLGNEANIHIHKRFGMVPRVKALHDAVRAYDPTRFAEYGSDADADGVLPVCNIHYPYYDVLREETTYMPEMCYFHRFDQPLVPGLKIPCGQSRTLSCIGPGKNIIPYGEKPMIVHETAWDRQMEPPHPASRFAGEDAYNSAAGTVRLHHEWMAEYLKGHRDADPYAVTPWLNFAGDDLSRYYPLLDVFTLERWTHFYEGTPVVFQTDICHDLLAAEDVAFSWRLADAGGRRVAGGGETFEANGGELFRTKIAFAAPGPGVYTLEYGVRAGGRRAVHRRKIVVAARETGEKACAALVRARNVVRPSDPFDAAALKRAEAGETLVVLPRKDYPPELGLSLSQRTPAIGFTFRRNHPLLAEIDEEALRYWYPAHRIAHAAFFKPASGGWQTVIEAGGRQGLVYSLLLLRRWGRGAIILSRLELEPKVNPVAAQLVSNLLAYRAKAAGGRVGVSDPALLARLKEWGVDAHPLTDGKGDAVVYLTGDGKPPEGFRGKVVVRNPGARWGVALDAAHLRPWYRGRAVIAVRDPVLDGLTNADFFWRTRRDASPVSVNFTDPSLAIAELGSAEILGATDLTYPRFLARRGDVLFETLDWCSGSMRGDEPERIVTTLLANLGARVTPPSRALAPPGKAAVARADPEKADRLVAEAMRQKKLRAWLKAIALLKEANASDPLRVSIHREIGDCYALMGDDLNALKWYELSKAIDDNQPVVWDLIKATRARLDSARDGSASAAGNRVEK